MKVSFKLTLNGFKNAKAVMGGTQWRPAATNPPANHNQKITLETTQAADGRTIYLLTYEGERSPLKCGEASVVVEKLRRVGIRLQKSRAEKDCAGVYKYETSDSTMQWWETTEDTLSRRSLKDLFALLRKFNMEQAATRHAVAAAIKNILSKDALYIDMVKGRSEAILSASYPADKINRMRQNILLLAAAS